MFRLRSKASRLGISCIAVSFSCLLSGSTAHGDDFDVYYLGGQSNMDGYGYVSELPPELDGNVAGVMVFHGNTAEDKKPVDGRGTWEELSPGHGVGFQTDGKTNSLSERFGVELTFARELASAKPARCIAIIKYSRGGTSIAEEAAGTFGCWEPDFEQGEGPGQGINQYDHFLSTIRNAMSVVDIDGDGTPDTLTPRGILWMQGESDANNPDVAARYEANLKRLMDLVRAALRTDDLPVVIGRISDSGQDADGKVWDFGSVVRDAQASFVESDKAAALVTSTDEYGYSDKWHYNSEGYIDLGQQFAKAMLSLQESKPGSNHDSGDGSN